MPIKDGLTTFMWYLRCAGRYNLFSDLVLQAKNKLRTLSRTKSIWWSSSSIIMVFLKHRSHICSVSHPPLRYSVYILKKNEKHLIYNVSEHRKNTQLHKCDGRDSLISCNLDQTSILRLLFHNPLAFHNSGCFREIIGRIHQVTCH